MTDEIKAKTDWYNGIEFRSKLESKTAQALDNIGIEYVYEPDGYKLSNGMWYRPDFWLPKAHQFIECKGVMHDTDSAKIYGLVEDTSRDVLVLGYDNAVMVMRFWRMTDSEVTTYKSGIWLSQCTECAGMWFAADCDTYQCACCGAYDGDHYFMPIYSIGSADDLWRFGQKVVASNPIYKQLTNEFNRKD